MSKGKRILEIIISVVLGLVLLSPFLVWFFLWPRPITSGVEVTVAQEKQFVAGNALQRDATLRLFSDNGKLYFYHGALHIPNRYLNSIQAFSENDVKTVLRTGGQLWYLAYSEGYVYYVQAYPEEWIAYFLSIDTPIIYDLYCYSLESGEKTLLQTIDFAGNYDIYIEEDGTLYIPTDYTKTLWLPILGKTVGEPVAWRQEFQYGDKTYFVREGNTNRLFYIQNGEEREVAGDKRVSAYTVIPCEEGLLAHSGGAKLCYIDGKSGEVRWCFDVECSSSIGAVNVYEDNVFLSFMRFDLQGTNIAPPRYKDDEIEGTYRINLKTGEAVKISDAIYDGIYIWKENEIFTVDDRGQIFKLDFDGNCIETLLTYPKAYVAE